MASTYSLQHKRESAIVHPVREQALQFISGRYLLETFLVFVAYVIAGKLGQATTNIRSSNLGPVWPASGIALAAILICGYRVWPGVLAGTLVVAFSSPVSHLTALGQAAGSTIAALIGAFSLYRFANFDRSLSRLSDVLSLIALGGFGDAMVSASIGVFALHAAHVHPYSGVGAAWLIYWLGDATGILLVTPLALRFTDFLNLRDRDRVTEVCVVLLLLSATCFLIFGDLPFIPVKLHFMAFAALPFIIWAAIRLGLGVTALSILIVASIATIETALGSGPFAKNTTFVNAVLLDVFFGVLSITGLSLAAVVDEREHAEREREEVVRKQTAMEVRLRSADALRESEQRFRLAAQAGKMYSFEWDVTTDLVVRSPERVKVLGGNEPLPISYQQFGETIHPDDRPRFTATMAGLTPENPTAEVIYRVRGSDGALVWLKSSGRAFFDSEGRMLRVIGMVADVTDQKLAEEALRTSEERLRLAQQAARIGTFEWNIRTGVNTWTPELEVMYGLPPGGFGGTQTAFENLVHPDDRAELIEKVDAAMKNGQLTTGEWRVVWPDGSAHWIAGRWQVFMNESGEPSRMIGVNIEITERKRAEEILQESEERFRSVFRDVGVGMIIVSPEGRFLAANKAFCDCLGYTEKELLEKTVESVTLSEDWPAFSQKLQEALTEGHGYQWFEKRCLHKSGRIVYTESSASLVRGRNGEPQYFVGDVLDVTKRKEAQQALADITRKLIKAQEQERARIGRELHDDINQRVAMLSLQLEQLQENPAETQSRIPELRQQIGEISDDVQALSHDLHSSKLEYLGVVGGIRSWCKEFAERQKIAIEFKSDVSSVLPLNLGLCLFRVLQQGLQNAVKHSGVRSVEVQLQEVSGEVNLTISDSGKGFDLEAALQGKGLGLTSMQERVRLVNGTIVIDSAPMHGTTIRVRVPFKFEDAQRAAV